VNFSACAALFRGKLLFLYLYLSHSLSSLPIPFISPSCRHYSYHPSLVPLVYGKRLLCPKLCYFNPSPEARVLCDRKKTHISNKYIPIHSGLCNTAIVTRMARALLGNGPVNTPRPNTHKATMEDVSQRRNVTVRC
jgi:hypothetical protein